MGVWNGTLRKGMGVWNGDITGEYGSIELRCVSVS